jgi:cytochrome c biogenesis factor
MKLVGSDVARSIDSRGAATSPAYNEVGINSSIVQDIVVRIRGIPSRVKVLATIGFEPFVELAWVGCALIFLGGAVTTRPRP